MVDLNALLGNIMAADAALKEADAIVKISLAEQVRRTGELRAAQRAFDSAIAEARGIVLPPEAVAPAATTAALVDDDAEPPTGIIPMGPLPPTSPALNTQPFGIDFGADDQDTMREDRVYEP